MIAECSKCGNGFLTEADDYAVLPRCDGYKLICYKCFCYGKELEELKEKAWMYDELNK